MSNVIKFPGRPVDIELFPIEPATETPKPFSFDIVQSVVGGFVQIDACVPSAMAFAFLAMLQAEHPAIPA